MEMKRILDLSSNVFGLCVCPCAHQVEKCEILSGGKRSHTAVDLVRTPQMRKRAIILFYIW